ncbi:MAG TPA: cytochrome c oxidase subunit 3 [Caulobacteraceae bacterium]|jgi:cytochrome c oxidase subunit 3
MAHGAVKHDYHLVNPSPWPLVGSLGALLLALGFVAWKKGIFGIAAGTWWPMAIGGAVVAYAMFGWWMDVIRESRRGDHTPVVQIGLRYGMILFIASEVMFFAAWFWMFFDMSLFAEKRMLSPIEEVRTAWTQWPPQGIETLDPFHLPLVNTLILLLSGTTVTWAHHALQTGHRAAARTGLILTVLLGLSFTAIQGYEYAEIFRHHEFFNEESVNSRLFPSTFIMATGFHGVHVIIGTIFLFVCLLRVMAGQFTPTKHFGFEAAAWYWHFVDVVWLFLFAFVYVWPALNATNAG